MKRVIHALALALASLLFIGTSTQARPKGRLDSGLSPKGGLRETLSTAASPRNYSVPPGKQKRRLRDKFNQAARRRSAQNKSKETAGDKSGAKGTSLRLPGPRVDGSKRKKNKDLPGPQP